MEKLKYLSGVKPTGDFHLGNYISTIKPIIDNNLQDDTLFLIADNHALTSDTKNISENKKNIHRILHSFGIKNIVYQSDFSEILELHWYLSCYTTKGLLNRAHGYKAITDKNISENKDIDKNVNMGLFNYPVLMTSDLVMFDCDKVFIGQDQTQHIEMAKDIVDRFNKKNKSDILSVPKPILKDDFLLKGYDGQKMSKSYGNIIPLMCSEKKLRKHIFSVKTNSKDKGESKYWNESPITEIYSGFAGEEEISDLEYKMYLGIGWGEVKQIVFDKINNEIKEAREKYFSSDNINLGLEKDNLKDELKHIVRSKMDEIKNILF